MPIRGEGLVDTANDGTQGDQLQRTVYVLHPNCAADELVFNT